jgi:hypothetical protein
LALTQAGAAEQARSLGDDTLDRCRDILGPNHPITLIAAAVLAFALTQTGAAEQARSLGDDTLDRCRDTLGPNNSTTLFAEQIAESWSRDNGTSPTLMPTSRG